MKTLSDILTAVEILECKLEIANGKISKLTKILHAKINYQESSAEYKKANDDIEKLENPWYLVSCGGDFYYIEDFYDEGDEGTGKQILVKGFYTIERLESSLEFAGYDWKKDIMVGGGDESDCYEDLESWAEDLCVDSFDDIPEPFQIEMIGGIKRVNLQKEIDFLLKQNLIVEFK